MNAAVETKLQFRVLYRQFLFRVVDLEVLSADALGDSNRLLGQFAALLIVIGILILPGAAALLFAAKNMPADAQAQISLFVAQFLAATTMLAVGIFAVLSWDSIFPDRRDVFVLAPLPIRARTVFLAKQAAMGTALSLVVILLNCATGLVCPFGFDNKAGTLGIVRSFGAYWFAMFAAGIFIYCSVLILQGLAAQILPRRTFLRASGFLQMAAFCLFVCAYFLEPPADGLRMLVAPENHRLLVWLPSYWFLGLFHQLNGSMHAALVPLARRAWIGLTVAVLAAGLIYALSYMRMMRQIVEEPDITSGTKGSRLLPRFGDELQTAIGQFCLRTLARSRQHRLILAFYLGIGLAFTILLAQSFAPEPQPAGGLAPNLWHEANIPLLLVATIMVMTLAVMGTRVVFTLPLDLRANWIFRAVGVHDAARILAASQRALLLLSVLPVWLISAAVCLWLWPLRQAVAHLVVLGLLGLILADLCLWGFRKIPFTCSYLPGKSQVHMVVIAVAILLLFVAQGVIYEQEALQRPANLAILLVLLSVATLAIRWRMTLAARFDEEELQFEQTDPSSLVELGLYRDGSVIGGSTREQ